VFLQLNVSLRITQKGRRSPGFPAPTGTQRARPGHNGMYSSVGWDVDASDLHNDPREHSCKHQHQHQHQRQSSQQARARDHVCQARAIEFVPPDEPTPPGVLSEHLVPERAERNDQKRDFFLGCGV
jgi:hypothetical protein